MLLRSLFVLFHLLLCTASYAADWKCYFQDDVLFVNFKPDNNEKISWAYPGSKGQPTVIDLSKSENLESYQILWPYPYIEDSEDGREYIYKSNANIPILLTAKDKTQPVNVVADIQYVVCGNDMCKTDSVRFTEKALISDVKHEDFISPIVVSNASISEQQLIINVFSKKNLKKAKFLLSDLSNFVIEPLSIEHQSNNAKIYFNLPEKVKLSALQLFSNKSKIPSKISIKKHISVYTALLLAFLGGLILNFMPCVLPVLSLKMLSLTKFSESKYRTRILFTLLGIISTFLSFSAFSIACRRAGSYFGFGFHMQNTYFLISVAIIMVVFISIALERLKFSLEFTKIAAMPVSANYAGDFILGIISTLLATPCTAPFLGTALSFAMTQSNVENILVFLFVGLGFGTPYILALISYKSIKLIPKSGYWMHRFKYGLSILLILSLLWVLYILYTQLGERAVIVLTLILLLIKFFIENPKIPTLTKLTFIAICVFGSFYLPELAATQDEKYEHSLQKLWHRFNSEKINDYINQNKVVVIDVTASWCSYCQVNKLAVWDRSWTMKLLSSKDIIPMKADITSNNELSLQVHKFMEKHKITGIPITVVYGPRAPEGILIDEILTYSKLKHAIEQAR